MVTMPPPVNPQLWATFDRGLIVDALEGRGEFFIPNVTWRDQHDDALVLRQLAMWAVEREKWPEALKAVDSGLRRAADAGDIRAALGLAWAALLVGTDMHVALRSDSATSLAINLSQHPGDDPVARAISQSIRRRLEESAD